MRHVGVTRKAKQQACTASTMKSEIRHSGLTTRRWALRCSANFHIEPQQAVVVWEIRWKVIAAKSESSLSPLEQRLRGTAGAVSTTAAYETYGYRSRQAGKPYSHSGDQSYTNPASAGPNAKDAHRLPASGGPAVTCTYSGKVDLRAPCAKPTEVLRTTDSKTIGITSESENARKSVKIQRDTIVHRYR